MMQIIGVQEDKGPRLWHVSDIFAELNTPHILVTLTIWTHKNNPYLSFIYPKLAKIPRPLSLKLIMSKVHFSKKPINLKYTILQNIKPVLVHSCSHSQET